MSIWGSSVGLMLEHICHYYPQVQNAFYTTLLPIAHSDLNASIFAGGASSSEWIRIVNETPVGSLEVLREGKEWLLRQKHKARVGTDPALLR